MRLIGGSGGKLPGNPISGFLVLLFDLLEARADIEIDIRKAETVRAHVEQGADEFRLAGFNVERVALLEQATG